MDLGIVPAHFPQELRELDGLEPAGSQVDHVRLRGRVAHHLVRRRVHSQPRLTGREKDRVIVAQPIDGARSEAGHEPDEPVGALDPRRPAELVRAERHSRVGGQVPVAHSPADDLLDHDRHLLVHVEKTALGAVLDRVRPEHRGVDLRDRVLQRFEPLPLRSLVRQEEALVLARERGAGAVLQQAGAAHDQRALLQLVERHRQTPGELRREARVLEELDDVRVVLTDLIDRQVLAIVEILQLVGTDELQDPVRADVPGVGGPDPAQILAALGRLGHDLRPHEQPGALAAQLAATTRRRDDSLHELLEVAHLHVGLRRVQEVEPLEKETTQQRNAQLGLDGLGELRLVDRGLTVAVQRGGDGLQRTVGAFQDRREVSGLVLVDPLLDPPDDVLLAEVATGDGEGPLDQRLRLHQLLTHRGPVLVAEVLVPAGGRRRKRSEKLLGFLHSVPAQIVDHLPGDPQEQGAIRLPQEIQDHRPGATLRGRELLDPGVPFRRSATFSSPLQELADPFRERDQEASLVRQEGALVALRLLFGVGDADLPDRLVVDGERDLLRPWGIGVPFRLVDAILVDDAGLADVRVLPAGGNHLDDFPQRFVDVDPLAPEDVAGLVEAGELLRPLLEGGQHLVQRLLLGRVHGIP